MCTDLIGVQSSWNFIIIVWLSLQRFDSIAWWTVCCAKTWPVLQHLLMEVCLTWAGHPGPHLPEPFSPIC